MKATVKIVKTFTDKGKFLAVAKLCFDDSFVIHNVKLIDGDKGRFISFPSIKNGDEFRNTCHPITNEFRMELQELVETAYDQEIENN